MLTYVGVTLLDGRQGRGKAREGQSAESGLHCDFENARSLEKNLREVFSVMLDSFEQKSTSTSSTTSSSSSPTTSFDHRRRVHRRHRRRRRRIGVVVDDHLGAQKAPRRGWRHWARTAWARDREVFEAVNEGYKEVN